MAEGAADEAFGRAAELVQRGVRELAGHFGELLVAGPSAAAALPVPVGLLGSEAARTDLAAVRAAGEEALLEEVALDLLEESLRQHVIPHFWRHVPLPRSAEAGAGERFCAAWAGQLQGGVSALRVLHSAHGELLRGLGTPGVEQLARRYSVVFRIAFSETLPASFAEQAHRYFRWTWQRCSPHRRGRRHEPSAEEWWWAPLKSEAAAPAPAARVIALLNPARRPPVALNGVGSTAMDGSSEQDSGFDEAGDVSPGWPGADEGMLSFVPEEDVQDEDDAQPQVPACSDASAEGLRVTSEALQCMGLGEVWRDLVMRFVVEELGTTVEERCRSEYDSKGLLDQLTAWLYSPLLRWLRTAYGLPSVAGRQLPACDAAALEAEAAWWVAARRVVLQFFETFVEVRIREAFDMVRDFPDSMPALLDLRRCLAQTGRTAPLVRALRQQLTRRLLIAGAHTRDVIKVYIKTIKAMRLVDPRGLLLEAVSAPIRSYLKRRKDTIRCIITALTEDSDLQLELHLGAESTRGRGPGAARAGAGAPGDGATGDAAAAGGAAGAAARPSAQAAPAEPPDFAFGGADFDVSEDEEDPDAWTPDPIDTDPLLPSRQRRAQDVISLLVGIYGSKEMFIKEYKEMLADRLLGNPSYSTEREMQNLELLKTRFGEAALAHCEVMLQDIKDSKRINGNVQQLAKAKQAPAARQSAVLPFRPPSRAGLSEAGAGQRGFAAPFSLGSMFGLCLSPPGTAGATEAAASVAAGAAGAAGAALQAQGGAPTAAPAAEAAAAALAAGGPATDEEGQGLSLEQMHALVLSQHYWPSALAKADHPNFKLPASLEEALTDYSGVYGKVRARRSLQWKRVHGLVEMTVQLADRAIPVVVSPVHYAVLSCFTDRASSSEGAPQESTPGAPSASPRLSLQEVAAQVELPEALVRKRLSFWVAKGVLREVSAGVFDVQESLSTMESTGGNHLDEDVEHSPGQSAVRPGAGGGRDSAAELKVCEAFVQVVLTNSAAQPLGRIHNYLQMFMTDPQYTQTESQLRDFLSQLCQEGKLEFNGSNYSLVKKT